MKLVVVKEVVEGETRVALVPESVKKLTGAGFKIAIEPGAGERAFIPDAAYAEAGAAIEPNVEQLLGTADFVAKVGIPGVRPAEWTCAGRNEIDMLRAGAMLLSSLMPQRNPDVIRALAEKKITSMSTDTIPRTTRAQAMDTLSSMANIAGYRGALMGALLLGKYTPMLMTAAGTVSQARYFVIGAGVAGLQAIATAKRLGANLYATDVRPEVKEQIESVGARYVGIELKQSASAGGGYAGKLSEEDQARQRDMLAEQCALADVIITTALIGGVFAPKLITAATVRKMRPGSVIIDLAAEGGGNCELARPGQTILENGVTIAAPLNVAAAMPTHASVLWSRNLTNFLLAFWKDKAFNLDMNDEILKGAVITHAGEIVHPKTRDALLAGAA